MLFRVSFWNDRTDTEVFGKTIEAENECEAEGIFFDELEEENDYSDEYPVLVQETEKKYKLTGTLVVDIEIEVEASSYEAAWNKVYKKDVIDIVKEANILDSDIDPDSEDGDEYVEDNHSELPWDYGKHFE